MIRMSADAGRGRARMSDECFVYLGIQRRQWVGLEVGSCTNCRVAVVGLGYAVNEGKQGKAVKPSKSKS